MSSKEENLKEKLKQALNSTVKVISEDYKLTDQKDQINDIKEADYFQIENLNSKNDFIKARAEADTSALKKKFSNSEVYKKNMPANSSCKSLYSIAEKIRYQSLGRKMLKGVEKNLDENYYQIINLKRNDQIKTKEDMPVVEAFELYMLKKFHNIKLNLITTKMLSFWEKDFDEVIEKHLEFLRENLENQSKYSSKFSKILQDMRIFQNEEDINKKEEDKEEGQDSPSNDNQEDSSEDKKDQNDNEETEASLDSDYDINEYNLNEQLTDTNLDQQNNEQIIQKNLNEINLEYKIFTSEYDEITKAENLENSDDAIKLRKTLDQQLISFQDVITKLANKLQRQLLAKQNRAWDFDLEEGLLDSSKLTRIIMDPYNSLSFKKEKDLDFKDTIVTLLIDNSGSMRGRPIIIAAICADI